MTKTRHHYIMKKQHLLLFIIVMIIFVISFVYYYYHSIINEGTITSINSNKIVYQIEDVSLEKDLLFLRGWCFKQKVDTLEQNTLPKMRIILTENDDNSQRYYYSTDYDIYRPDVNEYYYDGYDYSKSGFQMIININNLDINKDYEIIIQPNDREDITVRPQIFIHQKGIMYAEPNKYIDLEVEGTDLEEIVNKGKLRFFNADIGMYVYQYNWRLYFIADNNYPFDKGWNKINYDAFTNQPEKLPDSYIEYSMQPLGSLFSEHEITDQIHAGRYRVYMRDIPIEYPITFIDIGYHTSEDGWLWRHRFCPGLP